MIKQTKIVATLGPASADTKVLEKMLKAGMNVARINFSHGDHAEHGARIDSVRAAASALGQPIAVLQDLCGPKIRIGDFVKGEVTLKKNDLFTITTRKVEGTKEIVSVSLSSLPSCVKQGMRIMLEDGKFILEVIKVEDEDIYTKVLAGGIIRSRRGVNVPGAMLPIGALTAKDKKDLAYGLTKNVDMVALSFVQTAKDITSLRTILNKVKSKALIIAKIETQAAIDNLDAIIAVADGIMIARGDLAVEVPKEDVPLLQKRMIRACRKLGKPVITATQMLDSMTDSPVPTRAEVADVANAVFDGTDAVMLSQESAVGDDPALVVETMASIAVNAETSDFYREAMEKRRPMNEITPTDVTTLSATHDAHLLGVKAIVAFTETGSTARMLSRHRPHLPIIALTPHKHVSRQLAVSFGVVSVVDASKVNQFEQAIALAKRVIVEKKYAKKGDTFILVAGLPFGMSGSTNTCSIQMV
ncbi:pyruvate kinase [Patescibacteria group bacterium]|nr:MAG: pyruvate kinase [Patescibacteria group bacterium]